MTLQTMADLVLQHVPEVHPGILGVLDEAREAGFVQRLALLVRHLAGVGAFVLAETEMKLGQGQSKG